MPNYKNIDLSIVFKTFLRPVCLDNLLNSINEYQNKYKIKFTEIIAVDDSDEECLEENKKVINKYPGLNINHITGSFNSFGTSIGRNKGIEAVKTEYFIMCDDDNLFDLECDLEKNLNFLKEKKLDLLGGYYRNITSIDASEYWEHNWLGFIRENETFDSCIIYEDFYPEFCFCDITENFYIAKTQSIKNSGYPEDMAQFEHNIFFLRLKQKGFQTGFTNEMFIKHFHITNKAKKYDNFRIKREVINPVSKEVKGILISSGYMYTFNDYLHIDRGVKFFPEPEQAEDKKKKYTITINLLIVKLSIYLSFMREIERLYERRIKPLIPKLKLAVIRFQYPKVMSLSETIDEILKGKSIARLGDGELQLIMGIGLGKSGEPNEYQVFDEKLSERLKEIIKNPLKNCIIGIDKFTDKWNDEKNYKNGLSYWENFWLNYWDKLKNFYKPEYKYGCTAIARITVFKENSLDKIKKIWDGKKVLFVIGNGSHFVYDKRLFDNIKEVKFIVTQGKSSFSRYDEILKQIKQFDKDWLIFLALGPAATVLAYDLSKEGRQALDLGHLSNSYLHAIGEREKPEVEHFKGKQFYKEEGIYDEI